MFTEALLTVYLLNLDMHVSVVIVDPYTDIYAFIVLMDGVKDADESIITDLQAIIRKQIGGFAVPQKCLVSKTLSRFVEILCISRSHDHHKTFYSPTQIVPGLPKTRSGKIMRRILKKIAANKPEDMGDTSTLADPSVVEIILKKHLENSR